MKKTFLILLITLISCKSKQEIISSTQEVVINSKFNNPNYKPLNKFEDDNLKYLQTNFLDHQDFYKGKPLNVLLNDLEIDIKNYTFGVSAKNINLSPDLSLNFYTPKQKEKQIKNKQNPLVLYVVWEVFLPQQKIVELLRKNDGHWTEEEKNYYGQHIIKEVGMVIPNY